MLTGAGGQRGRGFCAVSRREEPTGCVPPHPFPGGKGWGGAGVGALPPTGRLVPLLVPAAAACRSRGMWGLRGGTPETSGGAHGTRRFQRALPGITGLERTL